MKFTSKDLDLIIIALRLLLDAAEEDEDREWIMIWDRLLRKVQLFKMGNY